MISTCCRDCVFSVMGGKTQTECKLGRLEKFSHAGADVLLEKEFISIQNENALNPYPADYLYEADLDKFNILKPLPTDGYSYFTVAGRFCSAFRPPEWNADESVADELVERVYQEIRLDIEAFVYVDQASGEDSVLETIKSIQNDNFVVRNIAVVNNTGEYLPKVSSHLRKSGLPYWRIESLPAGTSRNKALDTAILPKTVKSGHYILVIDAGKKLTPGLLEKLNTRINVDVEPLILVDNGDCVFTMGDIYRAVDGSLGDVGFVEAIRRSVPELSSYKVEINEAEPTACVDSDS